MRRPILTVALLVTAFGGGIALISTRGRDVTHVHTGRVLQAGFALTEQEKVAEAPQAVPPPAAPAGLSIPPPISPNDLADPAPTIPTPTEELSPNPAIVNPTQNPLPPAIGSATPPVIEDPVQVVESFVDRNLTEANAAIAKLSEEAKELKERLAKVETALARWKKLSQALDQQNAGNEAAAEPPLESPPVGDVPPPVETVKEVGQEPPLEEAPR